MAIKKTVTTSFGVDVQNAYHRVGAINLTKKNAMSFSVGVFVDNVCKTPVRTESYACTYDLSGNNPLAQAYGHLKTLPEFAGATDC
jgi:hypothetical protein